MEGGDGVAIEVVTVEVDGISFEGAEKAWGCWVSWGGY